MGMLITQYGSELMETHSTHGLVTDHYGHDNKISYPVKGKQFIA
jgi:hypothetical protein